MEYLEGYVYHIKDEFFSKVQDRKLMQNKENGNFRPTYFCLRDPQTSLLWMIPMSSRCQKYQAIYEKQRKKYGKCITIVMGEYGGKKAAFLLQNMFPTSDYYLDHIHTINGNPVPVNSAIQKVIHSDFQQVRQLLRRNVKIVFPDVKRIEGIMLNELKTVCDYSVSQKENTPYNDMLIKLYKGKVQGRTPKSKDKDLER